MEIHCLFAVISSISGFDVSKFLKNGSILPKNALFGICIFMYVYFTRIPGYMQYLPGFPVNTYLYPIRISFVVAKRRACLAPWHSRRRRQAELRLTSLTEEGGDIKFVFLRREVVGRKGTHRLQHRNDCGQWTGKGRLPNRGHRGPSG